MKKVISKKQDCKVYVSNEQLEELPQLLRDHALSRLNEKGTNELINLLIAKIVQLEDIIKEVEEWQHRDYVEIVRSLLEILWTVMTLTENQFVKIAEINHPTISKNHTRVL